MEICIRKLSGVWSIHHKQLYGNLCLVCTAQTTVCQLMFGLYSTESCIPTCVRSLQHRQLYPNLCLVCTAQTAVCQIVFGLYSIDSCMATCVWSIQRRQLYAKFCSLDNTFLYKVLYTPSLLPILHTLIPYNT